MKKIMASIMAVTVIGLLAGCAMPYGGDVSINLQMLATRSAVASTNCVSGIEGGGTTTAEIPLK